MEITELPKRKERAYLKENFKGETWEELQPWFEELKSRKIEDAYALRKWFRDRSELESVVSEELGWRYIRMTGDTANTELVDRFNIYISEVQPKIAPYSNALDEKALKSPFLKEIKDAGYDILVRNLEKDFKIFREENIPLITEMEQEAQTYGSISGAMTVEMEGKELTLQQASDLLQSNERKVRETAYFKIGERRLKDKEKLDELYNKLITLRHKIANNAGFPNYRDYMFTAMGRFDYSVQDCFNFHDAVSTVVLPVLNEMALERKQALGLDKLKPWDLQVNYNGTEPLKPFDGPADLTAKTVACFNLIDSYLGSCITTMQKMGHLDLESRIGKAPGGYNYPLDETGVPFIFMNATSSLRDLETMVHEGGHALHSFVTRDLELNIFKHPPSEVAELASMAMELISMERWDIFFPNEKDLLRAKIEHLEGIIQTLPWVAAIDKFQHWIYENPTHTTTERNQQWKEIMDKFSSSHTDWSGAEEFRDYLWQKQLHLYEVPFYYIEYGIAQLGAIAVWKNYKENPEIGFQQYLNALKLGYSKPIGEIYKAAGIKFDFSRENIQTLISFVKKQLDYFKSKR